MEQPRSSRRKSGRSPVDAVPPAIDTLQQLWPITQTDTSDVDRLGNSLNAAGPGFHTPLAETEEFYNPSSETRAENRANHRSSGEQAIEFDADLISADSQPARFDPRFQNTPGGFRADTQRVHEQDPLASGLEKRGSLASSWHSSPHGNGPSITRPIVMVSLTEAEMQGIVSDALDAAAARDAQTAAEIAEDRVNEAFWIRNCEMRALTRGW